MGSGNNNWLIEFVVDQNKMSFSWNYLTRRFLFQNHRDYMAMTMIGSFVVGQFLTSVSAQDDNEFVTQHVYTNDESDIAYRQVTNKTDGAVKRDITMAYAEKIRKMRAERERAA